MATNMFDYDGSSSKVIHAFMEQNCGQGHIAEVLIANQINSYNDFLLKLEKLITRYLTLDITVPSKSTSSKSTAAYTIKVTGIDFARPSIREIDDTIVECYPAMARLRALDYSTNVTVTLQHGYTSNGRDFSYEEEKELVLIDGLPVMTNSKLCNLTGKNREQLLALGESWMDPGCMFIIKGNEKVIIPQERLADNLFTCFPINKKAFEAACKVLATTNQTYFHVKPTSVSMRSVTTKQKFHDMMISVPLLTEPVKLFTFFRALGIVSDKDIVEMIMHNTEDDDEMLELLRESATSAREPVAFNRPGDKGKPEKRIILTQQDALSYIAELVKNPPSNKDKQIQQLKKLVMTDLFTNAGHSDTVKAANIAYMARRLVMCVLGRRPYDDRDDMGNKRCDLSGALLNQITHANLAGLQRNIRNAIIKHLPTGQMFRGLGRLVQSNNIKQRLTYALSTGNWVLKNVTADLGDNKKGIAQIRGRISHISTLSNIRRVKSPLDDSGAKVVGPRRYHSTQIGANDIAETPEGKEVGVVKNMALCAHVTIESNPRPIYVLIIQYFKSLGVKPIEHAKSADKADGVSIILNGCLIAIVPNDTVLDFYQALRIMKRHSMLISPYMSIAWYYEWNEIIIETGAGRYCRPLYVVNETHDNLLIYSARWDALQETLRWDDFLHNNELGDESPNLFNGGVIEYLDVAEQKTMMIAYNNQMLRENTRSSGWWTKYTHCEIHPMLLLGVVSGIIPFPDHNQSPRNCYQSSMSKQSLGWFDVNFSTIMLGTVNYLQYPSRPLVATQIDQYVGIENLYHAYQSVVAIISHGGFNQEDSLILNGSATERGAFMSVRGRLYGAERARLKTPSSRANRFGLPPKNTSIKNPRSGRVRAEEILNKQGFPQVGTYLEPHEVVIGKYSVSDDERFDYIDRSVTVKKGEGGIVTRVIPSPDMPTVSTKLHDGTWIATNEDGQEFCRVMVEHIRMVNVADKFASRSAQKGTCGELKKQRDMPFTADGVVPDQIKNPHAVPSRMTVAQLQELPIAKAAALTGQRVDVTAFTELAPADGDEGLLHVDNLVVASNTDQGKWMTGVVIDVNHDSNEYSVRFDDGNISVLPRKSIRKNGLDAVGDVLESHGYQRFGDEIMYSGVTGEMLDTPCTIGPTVYQKLRHMVDDKWHARNGGPVQLLTHQPAEGRARDGGLRLGEMERDCFIAHGVAGILKERMMDCSDMFSMEVSAKHGQVIQANPDRDLYLYNGAQLTDDVVYNVQYPYACDLLRKELFATGIDLKYEF